MALGLNYIDIGIIVLIFLSALVGFIRGFVKEVFSLATWVAAILLAATFYEELSTKFPFTIPHDLARLGLAFILIFIGVLIVGSLINHLINKTIHAIGLGSIDRILGGAFGVIRGALVITLLVLLLNLGLTTFTDSPFWKESKFVPHFKKGAEWVESVIPPDIEKKVMEFVETMGISTSKEQKNSIESKSELEGESKESIL